MADIGAYLVSVTAAALICGAAKALTPEGVLGTALKTVTGLMMVLAVASPWLDLRLPDISGWTESFRQEAENAAALGADSAMDALREGISQQTRTYIQDKAKLLDADLTVEVILSEDELPVPKGAVLRGAVSPYAKSVLSEYMRTELGIETEEQIWIT